MEETIVGAVIGVIGTVIGAVLGWILNSLSNKGKLKIYVSRWLDSFTHSDGYGGMTSSSNAEKTQLYSYDAYIDIYNSSAEPRILRDIKIIFNDGNNDFEISFPIDKKSKREGRSSSLNGIEAQTVPAKSVLQLQLHDGKWKEDKRDIFIWKARKVFFEYKDNKNKKRRILLKKEDYSRYFENHPQEENHNG